MILNVKNLNYALGSKQLLNNININIEKPQLIGIIGANGAGKSTLLNCLCGLNTCHESIEINGQLIEHYALSELAECRAVLPQHTNLNFPFMAHEIVAMSFALCAISNAKKDQIILECLEAMSAKHLSSRNFLNLSGGEKQRVHIARVLAQLMINKNTQHKQILFLDEPTAPLDLKYQYQLFDYLKTLKNDKTTTITVIHDLNLAATYCDELWVMKDGRLIEKGSPNQLITQSMLNEVFDVNLDVTLRHKTPHIYKTL